MNVLSSLFKKLCETQIQSTLRCLLLYATVFFLVNRQFCRTMEVVVLPFPLSFSALNHVEFGCDICLGLYHAEVG